MVCIGVDLGQKRDYSVIAVVTRPEVLTQTMGRQPWQVWVERETGAAELRFLERLRLGTPYEEVVRRIVYIARHEALGPGRRRLVVDATGVGNPVVERIRAARPGCDFRPVTIVGGMGQRYSDGMYRVGKTDLISGLRAGMESGDVAVAGRLRETPALVKELAAFGNSTSGNSSGHDDMVIALALAVWGVKERVMGEMGNVRIV